MLHRLFRLTAWLRRNRQRLTWVALLLILFWLGSSFAVARHLTGRPRAPFAEPAPVVAWGTLQPLRLATADGQDLGAWFLAGDPGRPVVVLLHGNGGGRTNCLPQAELAAAEGFGSLLVTLRAHSDSTGATNDFGYGARHDVAAAVAWLEARQPGRPILIWGQSLGAAAALFAAPDLGGRVAGYLLECPYRDLRTAVRNRTRYYLPPILDAAAYAGLVTVAPMVLPDLDRIAPIAAAGAIPPTVPVLILAGGADRRALPEEARDLAARIGPNARLRLFPSGDHAQLLEADPAGYRAEVVGFLQGRVATALAPFQDRR